jgi:hypothetical protein
MPKSLSPERMTMRVRRELDGWTAGRGDTPWIDRMDGLILWAFAGLMGLILWIAWGRPWSV